MGAPWVTANCLGRSYRSQRWGQGTGLAQRGDHKAEEPGGLEAPGEGRAGSTMSIVSSVAGAGLAVPACLPSPFPPLSPGSSKDTLK